MKQLESPKSFYLRALYTVSSVFRSVSVPVKVSVKSALKQKNGNSELKLICGCTGQPEVAISVVR
jgi:hypothetical protein